MNEMPIFQIVRISDTRVVIRYYNEAADKFEKICSAQDGVIGIRGLNVSHPRDYLLLDDKLLITPDGRICYSYDGRLYYPGNVSQLVRMMSSSKDDMQMLDISVLRLPVRYLFILPKSESFEEVVSYQKIKEGIELQTLTHRCLRYTLVQDSYDDPDEGSVSYTYLSRR